MQSNQEMFSNLRALLERNSNSYTPLENKFRQWAKPPSDTETAKCDHAVNMVKKAIAADQKLSTLDITVFAKGSYHNRTNIPSDSDVDVAVLLNTVFFNIYPYGMNASQFNFVDATYTYEMFKDDLSKAMVKAFGKDGVTVGDKAILIHSNTVRVDADVVPHAVHRILKNDGTYDLEGVAIKTRTGKVIYNWPEQDYVNGISKNDDTSKRYKAFTRVIKNLRCEMIEKEIQSATPMASYLIACLVYNIPKELFEGDSYVAAIKNCISYLFHALDNINNYRSWKEVNGIKPLFSAEQPWNVISVRNFLADAYRYIEGMEK